MRDINLWNAYLSDGEYWLRKGCIVETIKETYEQDFKTAIAKGIKPIPKGEKVTVYSVMQNFYGKYLRVFYNGRIYSIDPKDVIYIGS